MSPLPGRRVTTDHGSDTRRIKTQSQFHPLLNHWSKKLYILWIQTYATLRMFLFCFCLFFQQEHSLAWLWTFGIHQNSRRGCGLHFRKCGGEGTLNLFFFPEHYTCLLRFWLYYSACCYLFGCPSGRCCSNLSTCFMHPKPMSYLTQS